MDFVSRRSLSRSLAVSLACALLAACAPAGQGSTDAPPSTEPAGPDIVGAWVLERGVGPDGLIAIPDEMRITLILNGPHPGGQACNHYGVEVHHSGARVGFTLGSMTDMACAEAIMIAEAAYAAALETVDSAERPDDETLILRGEGGTELTFARLRDAPAAELVGTVWQLESLVNGDVAAAPMGEPTLRFGDDGTLAASTGCREFVGDGLRAVGDQMVMTNFGATDHTIECLGAIGQQDGHVVEVLGDGFIAELDGDALTLRDPSGLGLRYRAAD
jgi:heat shock protein HslJ